MNKITHILFSVAWYPNTSEKQCSTFIKNHAEAISQYCKVSVLGVFPSEKHRRLKLEHKNINKNLNEYLVYIKKRPVEKSSFHRILTGFSYFIGYIVGLLAILYREKRFSIMHINVLTRAGVIPYFIHTFFKTPYIITEHWSRYFSEKTFKTKGFHYQITKQIVKKADSVYCASKRLVNSMQDIGLKNNHYSTFHNTIDTSIFSPRNKKNGITRFVTVARMDEDSKNISGILNVLSRIKNNNYRFQYTFVGDGKDFEVIKNKAVKLNLTDIVIFQGHLNSKAVATEFINADCTILFSNYESQPVSIIESLACGTPVIATNVGDIKEMISEKCGKIIDPKDEKALYVEMIKFIEQKTHYSPKYCQSQTIKYSYAEVGKSFYNIYTKIDSNHNE